MKRYHSPIFFVFIVSFLLLSCNDDSTKKDNDVLSTNQWIEANMRHWYYWYHQIPSSSKLNFSNNPEAFFETLLSPEDGKNTYHYSTINKKVGITTRKSNSEPVLGFEFQAYMFENSHIAINVLYVLPNSPADKKGIKRGQWIHRINNVLIQANDIKLLRSNQTLTLGLNDTWQNNTPLMNVNIAPEVIEDDPVFYSSIITGQDTGMRRVGYLVYNHFTSGPNGDDDLTYNNRLKSEFSKFKAAGVNEFILDLRYNGGGLVTCAQLLSQMLSPQASLGGVFCETHYNDKVNKNVLYNLQPNKENLDLTRLFVLTTNRTASASEAVINGLRPYYDVVLIGDRTEGKNVGSITLSDHKYEYELHPIVCKVFNSRRESNYENGFSPNWQAKGRQLLLESPVEFGDRTNDLFLNVALQMIRGEVTRTRSLSTDTLQIKSIYNSLLEHPNRGMRLGTIYMDTDL